MAEFLSNVRSQKWDWIIYYNYSSAVGRAVFQPNIPLCNERPKKHLRIFEPFIDSIQTTVKRLLIFS
jgi:hypothetical protein